MNRMLVFVALAAGPFLLQGCGEERKATEEVAAKPQSTTIPAPPPEPQPHVVEFRAVGKTFQGPSEIPAGWTTFRFVNASSMTHFAMLDVPPEGITAREISDAVMQPFQDAMDGMNAGDEEAVNAAFGRFPEWIGELGRNGGPGFLSPGRAGQTTVYLEPGHYIMECYVKSDGIFHTTSPGEGQLGMLLDLTVTNQNSNAPEPQANATLAIRNSGFELVSGELNTGTNTIRVDFIEQQALPSFVGNDVHLMRVDGEDSIAKADAWLDWRTPDGLEDPSPVTFLGGINDITAGAHGYFTVDLEPGDYAFIAEMPGPQAAGFVLPFTVGE
ncbi:MAG: hypothetical protein OQK01_14795 [Xanthomonadales bacterium]|jgi:hypothetical protein|nr:hypothetical protein [Xanthomonadales bacterium]